tara:strand:- start:69017 stop:70120 length:1104 start_codon:yes stop_codon:yes gene_type:complete
MLYKLDNSFSFSPSELKNQVYDILKEIDVDKEIEKNINLIKSYLIDDKLFYEWSISIFQKFHLSIPNEIKNNCKVCKGTSDLPDDMACGNQYDIADDEFITLIILHVVLIENNKHLFKSKDLIRPLTNTFFESFEFTEGKLSFNFDKYDNTVLTNILLLLRKSFSEMETETAVKEINETIEEIETHKVIAKSTNRVLSNFVKPQLRFLKKQLKYYEKKMLTEPSTNNPTNSNGKDDNNICPYSVYTNIFQKSMPFKIAVNHFKIFTTTNSKNGEPFLTKDQLDIFIKKAFCGIPDLPKQTFNQMPKGEKFIIQYRFREFYEKHWEYFGTGQVQEKFIELLTDNFTDWDYQNVRNNFKTKPKKTIQLL